MQSIRQPKWRDLAILLVGYVALDWASFFHSLHALNITPWNPAPALGLIYLLRFGRAAVLPLALAIFLADASVRHLPVSLLVSIGLSLLLAAGYPAVNVLEIQILAAALALFGFFSGVVVDEKQRVSAELRQTLRLAAAGEMAGALAHELNQPLTALSAYGSACKTLVELGQTGAQLSEVIDRMVAETFRAGDVLRRLRDFFRTGATRLEHVHIAELIASVAGSMGDRATQRGVELTLGDVPDYTLLADRLQIEVVLRNLLSNAFDALAEQAAGKRRIWLTVRQEGAGRLGVCIENSGPGISSANAERLFEAFHTSKESGLGLGLVISRAIVEAHGGHLWAEAADHGFFRLILPMEGKLEHANQGIHGLHR